MKTAIQTLVIFLATQLLPLAANAHSGHGNEHTLVHLEWIVGLLMLMIISLRLVTLKVKDRALAKHKEL